MTDAPTASPLTGHQRLEVPSGVESVDLEAKFTQLLFRASLLGNKLTEQKQQARAAQRELLGVLVDVDDALAALGLDRELVAHGRGAGLEATRRRLLGRLAKAGVRPMRLDGLAADPALTEIVGTEVRPGVAPETVLQTVVTGFFWEQEVLRRAQVVVAAPESALPPVEDPRLGVYGYAEPAEAEPLAASVGGPAAAPVEEPVEEPVGGPAQAEEAEEAEKPEDPAGPGEPGHPEAPATEAVAGEAPARPVPPRARRAAKTAAAGRPAKRAKRKK
ncbi:nucleotide exchange factor GrpE [Streptomyces sp. CBMA123]|uniref:nucleotide exchange factor GrpE n=1 Tax=Streptomyces sp. CBMA123 TaxID=1896313 RepID=UPI001661D9C5|nr:nucleotide exchange factor GrpE [Streptomyces sp. CBMA123]MBD0693871.1 nucleotide exchange factor GrpE [Streptomyces sp. CBMA123]